MEIEQELEKLKTHLISIKKLKPITFNEAKNYENSCIYSVINNENEIIYIGKTGRTGKLRLREMGADFRSHTLNRKLLKIKLNNKLRLQLNSISNRTKKQLIESGETNEHDFKKLQKEINEIIKQEFMFKILPIKRDQLTQVEHFLISVFNPKFND